MFHPNLVPGLSLFLLAVNGPGQEGDSAILERKPVEQKLADGRVLHAERGRLRVPIVRANPDSRPIEIDFWRFLAQDGAPAGVPAVVELQGGPGWQGVEANQIDWEGQVEEITRFADLVYVGQRGIGTSTDMPCDASVLGPAELPEGARDDRALQGRLVHERCSACRAHWEAEGYDVSGLNVREAAADVADVARLLGYEKITLMGGSFGSHWSMAVLRFHETLVARALLHGLEGPDHTYDMPSGVLHSLERMAAAAEADPALTEHIPEGGLIAALRSVIEAVDEDPFEVEVVHPRSGAKALVRIDGDGLRDLALGYRGRVSSRGGMPTWPGDVIALHRGEFDGAARALLQSREGTLDLPGAAFFGLDCGSGITRARLEQLRNDPAIAVVGDTSAFYESACSAWNTDMGDDFRNGFHTTVPTVIVHGMWDVNTPFENALECLPFFENVHFIPVDGGSHGAFGESLRSESGFREAFLAFLATGATDDLPAEIALPPIRWVAPR